MNNPQIWAGMRIPILMASGPVNSGKSLLALTIDPNTRKPASEVKPTTIVWDQEGSCDAYVGGLNFEYKDTRAAVGAGVHLQTMSAGPTDPHWRKILLEKADVNDNPAASMFRAWYLSLLSIPAGQYTVGVCDTFTPLQDGLIEWLRRHPEAFSRSASQYDKAASMFLWPDIKAILSHILATDCRTRFDTFVLNLHLKNEWAGGAKTGRLVAEGLDTLEKLATLHLELDRTPKEKGKEAPRVPSAIVKKERLVRFGVTPDDDQPILPPRMPICTPDAIRKYILAPPNFANLAAGERLPDSSMGDDEKLRIQAAIAENQRAAEEARLSALDLARRAAETGRATALATAPATSPTMSPSITHFQATEMMGLLRFLFATGTEASQWLFDRYSTAIPAELSESKATDVLSALHRLKAERQMPATPAPSPTTDQASPQGVPPPLPIQQPPATAPPPIPDGNGNGRCTIEQRGKIRDLTMQIYGERAAAAQGAWLSQLEYESALSATHEQAASRITKLELLLKTNKPGDDCPF